jgi:probable F420-dependent oxidoreductase
MRFLYQYPEHPGPGRSLLDSGPVAEHAVAAERAGWHGIAFSEHPAPSGKWLDSGGHETLDPLVTLAHVAAVTTTLRLVTNLAVAPYRNPMLLAKAAATVDLLSGGRLTLGLGAGYLKAEFAALGVDFEHRNARVDETLDVLPLAWAGDTFSYRGEHFEIRDAVIRPRPVQQPIPIWMGGNARLTMRRVAERADGWLALMSAADISRTTRTPPLATAEDLAARVRELRTLAGERADRLDVVAVYTDPTMASAPTAEVERHRDALGRLADAGATWVVILAPGGEPPACLNYLASVGDTYIH